MKPLATRLNAFGAFLALSLTPTAESLAEATNTSHESWQRVLEQFVDPRGFVDYHALAESRQDLDHYLALVTSTSPASHPDLFPTRDHQLAFYINAYNALVFDGVLSLGPDATTVWGASGIGYGFFVKHKITVGGKRTNLRKLENQVIRDQFQDPRIHAALNCASLGCPRLPREAFAAETLDQQLDAAMTEFVGNEQHCRVDREAGTVTLSKIFDWFRADFEDHQARQGAAKGLIGYINHFRGDDQIPTGSKIKFGAYDKGLNRAP